MQRPKRRRLLTQTPSVLEQLLLQGQAPIRQELLPLLQASLQQLQVQASLQQLAEPLAC
jgi:hypothetical protein